MRISDWSSDVCSSDLFAGEQCSARGGRARRPADDADHLVEIGDRDDETEQDMGAFAGLEQLELGAPGDDLFAELDERLDDIAQVERFGPAAAEREHVGGKRPLRVALAAVLLEDNFQCGRPLAYGADAQVQAAEWMNSGVG